MCSLKFTSQTVYNFYTCFQCLHNVNINGHHLHRHRHTIKHVDVYLFFVVSPLLNVLCSVSTRVLSCAFCFDTLASRPGTEVTLSYLLISFLTPATARPCSLHQGEGQRASGPTRAGGLGAGGSSVWLRGEARQRGDKSRAL